MYQCVIDHDPIGPRTHTRWFLPLTLHRYKNHRVTPEIGLTVAPGCGSPHSRPLTPPSAPWTAGRRPRLLARREGPKRCGMATRSPRQLVGQVDVRRAG